MNTFDWAVPRCAGKAGQRSQTRLQQGKRVGSAVTREVNVEEAIIQLAGMPLFFSIIDKMCL